MSKRLGSNNKKIDYEEDEDLSSSSSEEEQEVKSPSESESESESDSSSDSGSSSDEEEEDVPKKRLRAKDSLPYLHALIQKKRGKKLSSSTPLGAAKNQNESWTSSPTPSTSSSYSSSSSSNTCKLVAKLPKTSPIIKYDLNFEEKVDDYEFDTLTERIYTSNSKRARLHFNPVMFVLEFSKGQDPTVIRHCLRDYLDETFRSNLIAERTPISSRWPVKSILRGNPQGFEQAMGDVIAVHIEKKAARLAKKEKAAAYKIRLEEVKQQLIQQREEEAAKQQLILLQVPTLAIMGLKKIKKEEDGDKDNDKK